MNGSHRFNRLRRAATANTSTGSPQTRARRRLLVIDVVQLVLQLVLAGLLVLGGHRLAIDTARGCSRRSRTCTGLQSGPYCALASVCAPPRRCHWGTDGALTTLRLRLNDASAILNDDSAIEGGAPGVYAAAGGCRMSPHPWHGRKRLRGRLRSRPARGGLRDICEVALYLVEHTPADSRRAAAAAAALREQRAPVARSLRRAAQALVARPERVYVWK